MAHSSMTPRDGGRGRRAVKRGAPREGPVGRTSSGGKPKAKRNNDPKSRCERYLEMARAAAVSGDEIAAEGHYQHAEHYFRLMNAGTTSTPSGGRENPSTLR